MSLAFVQLFFWLVSLLIKSSFALEKTVYITWCFINNPFVCPTYGRQELGTYDNPYVGLVNGLAKALADNPVPADSSMTLTILFEKGPYIVIPQELEPFFPFFTPFKNYDAYIIMDSYDGPSFNILAQREPLLKDLAAISLREERVSFEFTQGVTMNNIAFEGSDMHMATETCITDSLGCCEMNFNNLKNMYNKCDIFKKFKSTIRYSEELIKGLLSFIGSEKYDYQIKVELSNVFFLTINGINRFESVIHFDEKLKSIDFKADTLVVKDSYCPSGALKIVRTVKNKEVFKFTFINFAIDQYNPFKLTEYPFRSPNVREHINIINIVNINCDILFFNVSVSNSYFMDQVFAIENSSKITFQNNSYGLYYPFSINNSMVNMEYILFGSDSIFKSLDEYYSENIDILISQNFSTKNVIGVNSVVNMRLSIFNLGDFEISTYFDNGLFHLFHNNTFNLEICGFPFRTNDLDQSILVNGRNNTLTFFNVTFALYVKVLRMEDGTNNNIYFRNSTLMYMILGGRNFHVQMSKSNNFYFEHMVFDSYLSATIFELTESSEILIDIKKSTFSNMLFDGYMNILVYTCVNCTTYVTNTVYENVNSMLIGSVVLGHSNQNASFFFLNNTYRTVFALYSAIVVLSNSQLTILNCSFTNYSSTYGLIFASNNIIIKVRDSIFRDSPIYTPGVENYVGPVINSEECDLTLLNITMNDINTEREGGLVFAMSSRVYVRDLRAKDLSVEDGMFYFLLYCKADIADVDVKNIIKGGFINLVSIENSLVMTRGSFITFRSDSFFAIMQSSSLNILIENSYFADFYVSQDAGILIVGQLNKKFLVRNCTFEKIENLWKAGILFSRKDNLIEIRNCTINEVRALDGGLIFSFFSYVMLVDCAVYNLSALNMASMLYLYQSEIYFSNVTIRKSTANVYGSGYFDKSVVTFKDVLLDELDCKSDSSLFVIRMGSFILTRVKLLKAKTGVNSPQRSIIQIEEADRITFEDMNIENSRANYIIDAMDVPEIKLLRINFLNNNAGILYTRASLGAWTTFVKINNLKLVTNSILNEEGSMVHIADAKTVEIKDLNSNRLYFNDVLLGEIDTRSMSFIEIASANILNITNIYVRDHYNSTNAILFQIAGVNHSLVQILDVEMGPYCQFLKADNLFVMSIFRKIIVANAHTHSMMSLINCPEYILEHSFFLNFSYLSSQEIYDLYITSETFFTIDSCNVQIQFCIFDNPDDVKDSSVDSIVCLRINQAYNPSLIATLNIISTAFSNTGDMVLQASIPGAAVTLNRITLKRKGPAHMNGMAFQFPRFVTVLECQFEGLGGRSTGTSALHIFGDGERLCIIHIKNSLFIHNTAIQGGAASFHGKVAVTINASNFTRNTAQISTELDESYIGSTGVGGAMIYNCSSKKGAQCGLYFSNTLFLENNAENYGGNIFCYNNTKNISLSSNNLFINNSDNQNYSSFIGSYPTSISLREIVIDGIEEKTFFDGSTNKTYKREPDLIIVKNFKPNDLIFNILDAFGQIAVYDSSSNVTLARNETLQQDGEFFISDSTGVTYNGQVHYTSLQLKGEFDKIYTFRVEKVDKFGSFLNSSNLSTQFLTRPCFSGEVNNSDLSCFICDGGYYSLARKQQCKSCPAYASCAGGANLLPIVNYWRSDEASDWIIKCPIAGTCLKANDPLGAIIPCERGYRGALCVECEVGYTKNTIRGECNECRVSFILIISILCKILFFIGYTTYQVKNSMKKGDNNEGVLMAPIFVNIVRDHFNQMFIILSIPSVWDNAINQIYSAFNIGSEVVSDQVLNLECLLLKGDWADYPLLFFKIISSFILPVAQTIIVTLVWILSYFFERVRAAIKKKKSSFKAKAILYLIFPTFCVIVTNLYSALVLNINNLFNCEQLHSYDTKKFLYLSPTIDCNGSEYNNFFLFIGLPYLLIWVIGFPLFVLFFLWANRKKIKKFHDKLNSNTAGQSLPSKKAVKEGPKRINGSYRENEKIISMKTMAFLFNNYSVTFYWWIVMVYLWKGVLIFIINFIDPEILFFLLIPFYFLLIVVYRVSQPFTKPIFNELQKLSFFLNFLLIFVAQISQSLATVDNRNEYDSYMNAIIYITLILNLIFIIHVIMLIIRHSQGKFDKLKEIKTKLMPLKSKKLAKSKFSEIHETQLTSNANQRTELFTVENMENTKIESIKENGKHSNKI